MATNNEKKPKKETRRSKTKLPGLNPGLNPRVRKDYIDTEYVDGVFNTKGEKVIRSMTEEEKEWLNQYYDEFVHTNFRKEDSMCESNEERRKCYNENNARNRCIYNTSKVRGMLLDKSRDLEDKVLEKYYEKNQSSYEDALNEYVDKRLKDDDF